MKQNNQNLIIRLVSACYKLLSPDCSSQKLAENFLFHNSNTIIANFVGILLYMHVSVANYGHLLEY